MLIPKFQAINFSSIKNINNVKINNFFYNPINFKGSLDKDTVEFSSTNLDKASLAQEQKEAIDSLEKQNAAYVKRKIADYNRSKMNRCIYIQGKPIKLSNSDYNLILQECKNSLIEFLSKHIKSDIEGISYIKWCRDKYIINKKDVEENNLVQNAIYWVDFGIEIGSELRKLRPAILWRTTRDKKIWTMIPLTTKRRSDKYYFHYDLECLNEGTAKIENMMNLSSKRILAPYFAKDKLAILTKEDYKKIKDIISKYYLFK